MSEPISAEPAPAGDRGAALGHPERLHPLFLLTGLGGAMRGMAGGYAFIGYLAVSGRAEFALLSALALLALLATGLFLYWKRFEYRVGASEIRIDSGILSRRHRSIPIDRIHDVEIQQGPLARLIGLARVKFETGAAGAGDADEGTLQAIALHRAEEIRRLVRERGGARAAPAEPSAEAEPAIVFAMDTRRLLLSGVFGFSLALFAGLFGLTQTAGDLLGFDPLAPGFWRGLLSPGNPIAAFALANRAGAAVAGIALLLLAGVATGIVRSVLRDFGFQLERVGVGLRRRRGLLTRSDVTIARARAQAAAIGSGPLREAFAWHELRLQSLGRDEGRTADHVLAPLARKEEIDGILTSLNWRPLPSRPDWQGVSRAYVLVFLVALIPLLLLALLQGAALLFAWTATHETARSAVMGELTPLGIGMGAALFAYALLASARMLAWRRTRYAIDEGRLLVRTGWWRRRLLILPVHRIQSIDLRQSFVERRFGVASLKFGVAGASGFVTHIIPALAQEKARELRNLLLSLDHGIRAGGGAIG